MNTDEKHYISALFTDWFAEFKSIGNILVCFVFAHLV